MRIKLKELKNIVFVDFKENEFTGFTVETKYDINGTEYEILTEEVNYIYAFELLDNKVYIDENYLLDVLLTKHIKPLENKEIYEHGYPESRLIPANFYEDCQDNYIETVKNEFCDRIENILRDYM